MKFRQNPELEFGKVGPSKAFKLSQRRNFRAILPQCHKINPMKLILSLLACLVQLSCFAWSGPGHMIIAAEAYRSLSPDLQKKVSEILKKDPDYEKWATSTQASGVFRRDQNDIHILRRDHGFEMDGETVRETFRPAKQAGCAKTIPNAAVNSLQNP